MEATVIDNTTPPHQPSAWAAPTGSPWGQKSVVMPCSLEDVMSEELAKDLQEKEDKELLKSYAFVEREEADGAEVGAATSEEVTAADSDESDFLLAQMLQRQFNEEHDQQLKREEAKYNGPSKVTLSFKNYRVTNPYDDEKDSSSDGEGEEWGLVEKPEPPLKFKRGVSGKGENMISKHDTAINAKKNAGKVMDRFPPDFETGDAEGIDMRLSNKVYNSLKKHSESEAKRELRLHEKKEHSTAEMAVDEKTRLLLYKLMNNDILETVNGVISTGKESVVLHADGGSMTEAFIPRECAIKVFKTTLTDFKNRSKYVRGDMRFAKDEFKKQNPRRIIKIWAEKEDNNLRRLEKYGIRVPRVVTLKKHVLVMEFIGEDHKPAPKLKDAHLGAADMQMAYEQCMDNMKRMYQMCSLVHADLSAYNMLWHHGRLYFIDVSQSVEKQHPHAMEFLLRDCRNVTEFFRKSGVPKVPNEYQLFNTITGLELQGEGADFLSQIESYEKNEEMLRFEQGKDYPFEYFFKKATDQHEAEKRLKGVSDEVHCIDDSDENEADDDSHTQTTQPSADHQPQDTDAGDAGWEEVGKKSWHKNK